MYPNILQKILLILTQQFSSALALLLLVFCVLQFSLITAQKNFFFSSNDLAPLCKMVLYLSPKFYILGFEASALHCNAGSPHVDSMI